MGAIIGISKMLEGHLLVQYVVGFRMLANLCKNFFLSFIFSAVTTWMSGAQWQTDVYFRFWLFNWLAINVFTAVIALFTSARRAGSGRADCLPRAQPRLSRSVSGAGAGAGILPYRVRPAAVPVPVCRAEHPVRLLFQHRQNDSEQTQTLSHSVSRADG